MPKPLLISGAEIFADGEVLKRGDLLIQGGKIRGIAPKIRAAGAEVVDARRRIAAPGLIDTQLNGGYEHSFNTATSGQIQEVGRRLLGDGVTGYLLTLPSQPKEVTLRAIGQAVEAAKGGGAAILGLHLEGPFLSLEKRGAHKPEHLRRPTPAELGEYAAAAKGLLRKMTLAPELPGALETIREGRRLGLILAIGHTTADARAFAEGVEAGASHVTHCFNAMPALHHREPSALNAALVTDAVSCGFIFDRVHLHADAARLLLRSKPPGKAVLVSDAVAAMGVPDGDFMSDGAAYEIRDGVVRVKGTSTIAGSARSLLYGVRCLVEDLKMKPAEAWALGSAAPAKLLGLKNKGVLRPGADADVVLLDKDWTVNAAYTRGTRAYGNPD
jgi:N-acetylglucosamine-6-phosphate deacetylase